jgi:hypothetical protein
MKKKNLVWIFAFFAMAATSAAVAAEFDKPFQSHWPDGTPYWVVLCTQADECYEDAYKWCNGGYIPLDKQFIPAGGFRFV